MHPLQKLVQLQKQGNKVGIYSACSANEYVLEAVMEKAKKTNSVCLVEATSNQVNQYGGYTGMKPQDFYDFCWQLANKIGLQTSQLILGGDHLGPLTWTDMVEAEAMVEAEVMVKEYVMAGFTKIHIDTSMRVADDDTSVALATAVIATRGARLAKACEDAYQELLKSNPSAIAPVYIIGSEVPIPGGAQEEEGLHVTLPEDFKATVETFKTAFEELSLQSAWQRVIAVVVQPGVEFGDTIIDEYNREAASALVATLSDYDSLVFEGHSTDYQTVKGLTEMVEDGIAILKVGPGLTFAAREAMFALAHIEEELLKDTSIKTSNFIKVLDEAMLANPKNWIKHYHGEEIQQAFKRKYSFSDRCRYYLPIPEVDASLSVLIKNLKENEIPLSLLSAYLPIQYTKVRNKELALDPEALVKDRVMDMIDEYLLATKQEEIKL